MSSDRPAGLDRSLAQVARWQCGIRHDVHVHVNAGQPTLRNPTYGRYLQSRLDRYKTDPALLTIEVVEGDSFWLDPAILLTLKSLTSQGVRLAIDDFPKWKSPRQLIAWLRTAERHQIQITHLKIDRSVIVKVCKSDEKTVLKIKEYLQLALELGIQVIAEGIENEDDARTMIGYGVDGLQGYGIQKPANAEVMETYFSSLYQPAAAGKTQRSVMTSH
jgi:EAL domain-containing protein (putative c-di-GMP-specific phosphodiesterase class I)